MMLLSVDPCVAIRDRARATSRCGPSSGPSSRPAAPRRSAASLRRERRPQSGFAPVFSYAALTGARGRARTRPSPAPHVSGFGISLPSTMYFEVSSSAARVAFGRPAPAALEQHVVLDDLGAELGRQLPVLDAPAPTPCPASIFDSVATASCCAMHERGDEAGLVLRSASRRRSRTSGAGSSRRDRTATSSPTRSRCPRPRRPVPCSGSRCSRTN